MDQHLKGLEQMGARFELEEGYIIGRCRKLKGAHITFDLPTVGGTENLLMAAALAEGETEILGAECVNISYPNFYQDLKTLAR